MLLSITIMHNIDIYYKVNYDKLHQSGLCRLGLILLTPIMITSRNTTYMSPEYCLYSLERSTALILSVWSLTGRFLVVFYTDIAYFLINMNNISLVHWSHVCLHQARSTKLTLCPTRSSDGAQYFAPIVHVSLRQPEWHLVNTLKAEQESMSPPDLYIALKCHISSIGVENIGFRISSIYFNDPLNNIWWVIILLAFARCSPAAC